MDPLLTSRIDPALLRVVDKRDTDRDNPSRRRRPAPEQSPSNPAEDNTAEPDQHEIDDLA